ncbi:MAG: 2-oxo acid dehydrogenase subunit E2 [Planctomycetaceae bacterium]|nr:2-oxo acid dehydrogenase subunit E2 [Planctomycetaceae bacterium]
MNKIPLTRIQKLIGSYMLKSKRTKPHGYLRVRADLTKLVNGRKAFCRKTNSHVTTNDFFIYGIAQSIVRWPLMGASLDPDENALVIPKDIGVGFAVAAPQGLVVPVIKQMQQKTLFQTALDSEELLKRSRANKLLPDDFDGATMVLTGLGMYGVNAFYAVSPLAATGIVSIGNFQDVAVAITDGFTMRKMMYISLAFDRRFIDEFYAAGFLNDMAAYLNDPTEMSR